MNKNDFLRICLQRAGTKEEEAYRTGFEWSGLEYYQMRLQNISERRVQALVVVEEKDEHFFEGILEWAEQNLREEQYASLACAMSNISPDQWNEIPNIIGFYPEEFWPYLRDTQMPRQAWQDLLQASNTPMEYGEPIPANSMHDAKDKVSFSSARRSLVGFKKRKMAEDFAKVRGSLVGGEPALIFEPTYECFLEIDRRVFGDVFVFSGRDRAELDIDIFRFNTFYGDMEDPNLDHQALRREKPMVSLFVRRNDIPDKANEIFSRIEELFYDDDMQPRFKKEKFDKQPYTEDDMKVIARAFAIAFAEITYLHPLRDNTGGTRDTFIRGLAADQELEWTKSKQQQKQEFNVVDKVRIYVDAKETGNEEVAEAMISDLSEYFQACIAPRGRSSMISH